MDHVVYLDAKADELMKILTNRKTMIARGATGRKMPYGRVNERDVLYFVLNNGEGQIRAKAVVANVLNSDKLSKEDSIRLIEQNQSKLNLTEIQLKRWGGKRYLVLIEISDVEEVVPFKIDRSDYGDMDDWLLVGSIADVRV